MNPGPGPLAVLMLFAGGLAALSAAMLGVRALMERVATRARGRGAGPGGPESGVR